MKKCFCRRKLHARLFYLRASSIFWIIILNCRGSSQYVLEYSLVTFWKTLKSFIRDYFWIAFCISLLSRVLWSRLQHAAVCFGFLQYDCLSLSSVSWRVEVHFPSCELVVICQWTVENVLIGPPVSGKHLNSSSVLALFLNPPCQLWTWQYFHMCSTGAKNDDFVVIVAKDASVYFTMRIDVIVSNFFCQGEKSVLSKSWKNHHGSIWDIKATPFIMFETRGEVLIVVDQGSKGYDCRNNFIL